MASSFYLPRALSAVPNHPPPSTPSVPLSQDFRADSVRVISIWKRSNVFDIQQRNANTKSLREATRRYRNRPHPPLIPPPPLRSKMFSLRFAICMRA
jgi:hypothetical protein